MLKGYSLMMTTLKVGVVAAGYVAAGLVAYAAVRIRMATTIGYDASGGMHAFGDSLLFVGVFGVVGLVPTATALFFLRPYRLFWRALSAFGLGVAVTGLAATILSAVGSQEAPPSLLGMWAALSVLRILVAPLLALLFLVCTVLSPYRFARWALLAATVTEAAVTAYAGFLWFVPLFSSRP